MTPVFIANKLRFFILLYLLLVVTEVFGVPKLQLPRSRVSSISELWNLQIISDFKGSKIINIKISVYNGSNILLYEAVSDNFVLQTGISNFNSNQHVVQVQNSNDQILNLLGNGDLTVVISMFAPGNYTELTQTKQIVRFDIGDFEQSTDSSSTNGIKKYIDIGGTIELTGLYNTRQDTLFYMPVDYFRLQTHHQAKLLGFPFIYDMYVTTEQKYTNQRLNSYSFKFDYETFKEQLVTKITQKLEAIEQIGDVRQILREGEDLSKANILDSLKENQLIKEEYINKFKEYIAIDSLKNYLGEYDDVRLKKTITELDKYRKEYDLKNKAKNLLAKKISDYVSDTIGNKMNKISSLSDSISGSLQNKAHDLSSKSIIDYVPDTLSNKMDDVLFLSDSVSGSLQNKYDWLLIKYNNNKDSLDRFIEKLNHYNVQDLLSFSKLNSIVNDKISSYEKYYNKKELEQLKQLKGGDLGQIEGQLTSASDKYHILERKELLLNGLKRFEMGTVYPYYSNYTVNGVVLNGYDISYTYKNIYTSFSGGKQLNIINDSVSSFLELKKPMLYAFAFGYGDKFDNHIHLNYSYGSRVLSNNSTGEDFVSRNHVIAPDFTYRFFKDKWKVSGQLPISFTDRQTSEGSNDNRRGFASELTVNGIVSKTTQVEISNSYISEYFHAFGVPFLFSNYLNYHQKIKQKIAQNITTEVGYKYEKFYKSERTSRAPTDIHTLEGLVNIVYKKWNINTMYAPVWFEVRDESRAKNLMHTSAVSLSSNYTIRKDKQLVSTVGLNYNSFYNAQTYISDFGSVVIENNVLQINKIFNYYINERLSVKGRHIVSINFSVQNGNLIDTSNINFAILGASYTQNINNKINYTITYQAMKQMRSYLRHNIQTQLNYNIGKYIGVGMILNYDYLDGVVESRNYYKTNAFQLMTKLVFKI